MRISRNILEKLFTRPLPTSEIIARALTLKSLEVERIEKVGEDEVFEIDVLPHRSSDCLSHYGIAREMSLIFSIPLSFSSDPASLRAVNSSAVRISTEPGTADRFIILSLSGLENGRKSPDWLKAALASLGERSRNPIVDITNYVLHLVGQPLHAYDADKLHRLSGEEVPTFHVGFAHKGEELVTLDGSAYTLTGKELLIRSGSGEGSKPLGFAGVKGGESTAVHEGTTSIFLEAAKFNSILIRTTRQKVKLQTSASKRFESEVPWDMPALGITVALNLFQEMFPNMSVNSLTDEHVKRPETTTIHLPKSRASKILGTDVSPADQKMILEKLGALVKDDGDAFLVTPPWFRIDLKIPEDLVEEIGRLHGYENIRATALPSRRAKPNPTIDTLEQIKDELVTAGYSEIITRSFREEGEVQLANPLAKNAPFLRVNLSDAISSALELNAHNAELLELEYVRVFEIGAVFTNDGESIRLSLGAMRTKNARTRVALLDELETIEVALEKKLGAPIRARRILQSFDNDRMLVEYNIDGLIAKTEKTHDWSMSEGQPVSYKEFSVYPYVLRDIALWVPKKTTAEKVKVIIQDTLGNELRVATLVDRFERDGRTSFAFRLVFQSDERTLSDGEVNAKMTALTKVFGDMRGFEVR
jgi:phenylalanyl-tRNA synthetase beta chain